MEMSSESEDSDVEQERRSTGHEERKSQNSGEEEKRGKEESGGRRPPPISSADEMNEGVEVNDTQDAQTENNTQEMAIDLELGTTQEANPEVKDQPEPGQSHSGVQNSCPNSSEKADTVSETAVTATESTHEAHPVSGVNTDDTGNKTVGITAAQMKEALARIKNSVARVKISRGDSNRAKDALRDGIKSNF